MSAAKAQFIEVGEGTDRRRIAVLKQLRPKKRYEQGLIWLPGFKSNMVSTKADALAGWAGENGYEFTRFDYSGHGQSGGTFEDGTIGKWLDEALAVFSELTNRRQILIGSSMGGWIALLLLRRLLEDEPAAATRIAALVLIAPAWDMSEMIWNAAPEDVRDELRHTGRYLRHSAYGDGPYPITMKLIEEGRAHLIRRRPFGPGRPVEIIHGRLDPDVPFGHSLDLQRLLPGDHVRLTQVPDGEHRLSRPQDLDVLFDRIDRLIAEQAARVARRMGSESH